MNKKTKKCIFVSGLIAILLIILLIYNIPQTLLKGGEILEMKLIKSIMTPGINGEREDFEIELTESEKEEISRNLEQLKLVKVTSRNPGATQKMTAYEVKMDVKLNDKIIGVNIIFTNQYTDIRVQSFDRAILIGDYKINRFITRNAHRKIVNEIFAGKLEEFD